MWKLSSSYLRFLTCFGVDILTARSCWWWLFWVFWLLLTLLPNMAGGMLDVDLPLSCDMNSCVKSWALPAAPALSAWRTVSQSACWVPPSTGVCRPPGGLTAWLRTEPRLTVRVRAWPDLRMVSCASLCRRLSTSSPLTASRRSPACSPAASDREEMLTCSERRVMYPDRPWHLNISAHISVSIVSRRTLDHTHTWGLDTDIYHKNYSLFQFYLDSG